MRTGYLPKRFEFCTQFIAEYRGVNRRNKLTNNDCSLQDII
jgi:hypothetical protein